jgi:hypothetical protein
MGGSSPAWCVLALGAALVFPSCDPPTPEQRSDEPQTAGVTIRDSAGIQIVENHAPIWGQQHRVLDGGPRNRKTTLGGLGTPPGDSAPLVYGIRWVAPLSDGRIAILSPVGDRQVLVFEPSSWLT